jgi:membrane protease YdiL (CAAX protease family)
MKKLLFVVLKSVCFFAVWLIFAFLTTLPPFQNITFIKNNPSVYRLLLELGPLLAVIISTVLFTKLIDKDKIKIGTYKHIGNNIIVGIVAGIIWICLPVTILYFTGILQFGQLQKINHLAIWIIASIINTVMQEYLVRGYLFSLIKSQYNAIAATIVTTLIFVLVHGISSPISILNVLTMSIFVTLLLILTDNLIATIIAHGIWNVLGSLLGCVSLADDYPMLFNSTLTGNGILTGGDQKIEGSIIVLVVNSIGIVIILFTLYKKRHHGRTSYENQ